MSTSRNTTKERPATIDEIDHRDNVAWFYSFSAAMIPFTAFCFAHSKGMTVRAVEAMVRSPVGVYGLFALPFITLGMEKSIYDTVQAWQGLDPTVRPADRGGFPSGGAGKNYLPSSCLSPAYLGFSNTTKLRSTIIQLDPGTASRWPQRKAIANCTRRRLLA